MKKPYKIMVIVLSFVGLLDALYLTITKMASIPACIGTGCHSVLSSMFSTVFNIPISVFGVIAYSVIFILSLRLYKDPSREDCSWGILGISFLGTLISVFLMSVQAFQLHKWCLFCVLSAVIMGGIFIVSLISQKKWDTLFSAQRDQVMSTMRIITLSSIGVLCLYFGIHYYGIGQSRHATLQSTDIIAQFADQSITLGELDRHLGVKMGKLKRTLYEERLTKLNDIVLDHEAKTQGISREKLIDMRFRKNPPVVPETEIQHFYDDNQSQFKGVSFDKIKDRIRSYLQHQRSKQGIKDFSEDLKRKYQFQLFIPRSFQFTIKNNPKQIVQIGPKNAKLKIVIFSDFECPHCKTVHHQLDDLYNKHPHDVSIQFRQFPLKMHSGSRLKALAALCADQQNQYLKYSNKIYTDLNALTQYQLATYAGQLNLNVTAFNQCLSAPETEFILNSDIVEGNRLSITSTPSLFFNEEYFLRFPDEAELAKLLK
jgi:uncharacterized membrane protein/predicted DsbA family dithiol-disulfide isomerase